MSRYLLGLSVAAVIIGHGVAPGQEDVQVSIAALDPCEVKRYDEDSYKGHAETPGLPDNLSAGEVLQFVTDSLCFKDNSWGDGDKEPHLLYEKGESEAQFQAQIIPERRAFNITTEDLREAPRVVAKVIVSPTPANTGSMVFNGLGYSIGVNYLLLSYDDLGGMHLFIISEAGVVGPEFGQAKEGFLHGHLPSDRKKVVPHFSDGLNPCTKKGDHHACFVDDPKQHILHTVPSTRGGIQVLTLGVKNLVPIVAVNTTSTWVKMNGICYCQGDNCH